MISIKSNSAKNLTNERRFSDTCQRRIQGAEPVLPLLTKSWIRPYMPTTLSSALSPKMLDGDY
jgi:hypothetical protein